jgi:polyhydroxyalkanoate synthesis regulator phasin
VAETPRQPDSRGLSDALRDAIERTFASSAGSATETRERAAELLDDVVRRGQEAREAVGQAGRRVARRGQEARDASAELGARVLEAIQGMRLPTRDDLAGLREDLEALERRLDDLERELDRNAEG